MKKSKYFMDFEQTPPEAKYTPLLKDLIHEFFHDDEDEFLKIATTMNKSSSHRTPFEKEFAKLFLEKFRWKEIGNPNPVIFMKLIRETYLGNIKKWNRTFELFENTLSNDPTLEQMFTTESTNKIDSSGSLTNYVLHKFSDTPQSQVSVLDDGYLTNVSDNSEDATTENLQEAEAEVVYKGHSKQEIELVENYYEKFRNIVKNAVNEFDTCFLTIY